MKWDPAFETVSSRSTAQNGGGDLMPSKSLRKELLDSSMDDYDLLEPDPVGHPVTSDSLKTQNPKNFFETII